MNSDYVQKHREDLDGVKTDEECIRKMLPAEQGINLKVEKNVKDIRDVVKEFCIKNRNAKNIVIYFAGKFQKRRNF